MSRGTCACRPSHSLGTPPGRSCCTSIAWGSGVGPRAAGWVRAMGWATSRLRPGYHVAVEIAVPHCARRAAITRLPHPPACCGTLPAETGTLHGYHHQALASCYPSSPASVALYACHWARLSLGSHVLLCGAGSLRLLSLPVATAMAAPGAGQ
ncbi:partitioning defective 3-like protein B-like [Platysternon megacephalum]|uniref:Partitioning defective 3-like protein B-like n=1 Tax=Platysternon megacephalum TaxID=55544 RepID=A0A4D9EZF1_9SAUR|nr:partitioning defective 3-like protein B-like [Platysternon megacephalum]